MNGMHLSKSKYCEYVQCNKLFWLNRYQKQDDEDDDSKKVLLAKGRKVGEVAKGRFGEYNDIPYDEDFSIMIEKTNELLKNKPNVITEASFSYDNNFCRVDILKNDSDGVEIYEVKSSTSVKELHRQDVAYQYFVLSNLGFNVKKACVVHINSDYYKREKELDIHRLFKIEDITDDVRQRQDEVRENIDRINEFMKVHDEDNEPKTDIGMQCPGRRIDSCDFWQYCTRDLPKPNVFDINGMKYEERFEKYHDGIISFEDLENDDSIVNPNFIEQIDFELHDREPKINKEKIKEFLSGLTYPLYFIDYESYQCPIPEFEDTKAYQQIPFQYSLHIIREEGASPEHKEFLAQIDDENMIRNFAESIIKNLPENGSVIVYNQQFEKGVNSKLAGMFDDLKDQIERINGNMVDMMKPFSERDYYVKEMNGSASLKSVLPALFPDDPELDYDELSLVHKGDEASNAFLSLLHKTPEEQKEIRQALLEYCRLDTLAMVKIWNKFREVTV